MHLPASAATRERFTGKADIYHSLPEMAGGWGNPMMRNEKEFLILDGAYVL